MTSTLVYIFPPFRLIPAQRQLLRSGAPIKLGSRAFELLVSLVERRDRTVSKGELLDLGWPNLVVEENNLQVQVVSLRKLLGHPAIATIPGRGYRFTLPVTQEGGDMPTSPVDVTPAVARVPDSAPGKGNLSTELPELFGRSDDLAHLVGLLDQFRLVTVAGAAGIGKTRLAQAAAMTRAGLAADGAWWVDLAPLNESSRVPDAVAIALGLRLGGATDATLTVMTALREQAPLLVLDNAEHLLEGVAAFVTRLRQAAPRVRLLVTSQEPLRIDDECVFRPDPLSLPDGDAPERVGASGAVALFVARAKAADRRFDLRVENNAVVAEICRRLDGIPLAIELAAARLPLLGLEGLRNKLDERFHVLTTGHRASLQRHQTLRAALEWSHHLLSIAEQTVLRRLAVFTGGFTLESAQQVAEDDEGIDRWDVLEHLGALVEKSLVVAEGDPAPRYRLLETTRLFALARLIDSGEVNSVRGRHRDYFLVLAETCQPALLTGDATRTIARLDLERDNLLAALAWAPDAEGAQAGLRLAAATHYYWFFRTLFRRGVEVARAALDRPGAHASSLERCRTLVMAGWLGSCAGQEAEPVECLAEALRLARDLADDRALCHVLAKFAQVRHDRSEDELARLLAIEAMAVGRRLGDCIELGEALMQRGQAHFRAREYDDAQRVFTEVLALRLRIDNMTGAISTCTALAELALETDRPEAAGPYIEEALALMTTVDAQIANLHCVELVAEWAAAMGRPETAVRLNAAYERLARLAGISDRFDPYQSVRLDRAGQALDVSTYDRVRAAGFALGHESALQVARAFMDEMRMPVPEAR